MIPGAEKYTDELTSYEKDVILPLVVKRLKTKIGKEKAVTNGHVVRVFKKHGYKLSEPRFRKIIQHIRINELILGVVSHGNGYFVANKKSDFDFNINSLNKKINSEIMTRDSLHFQKNKMFNIDENPF